MYKDIMGHLQWKETTGFVNQTPCDKENMMTVMITVMICDDSDDR